MRCSYCHDSIHDTAGMCSGCQTGLHPECWEEAARCPTLGCERAPLRLRWLDALWTALVFLALISLENLGPRFSVSCCFSDQRSGGPETPPAWARGRDREQAKYFPIPEPSHGITPQRGRIERGPRRRLAA